MWILDLPDLYRYTQKDTCDFVMGQQRLSARIQEMCLDKITHALVSKTFNGTGSVWCTHGCHICFLVKGRKSVILHPQKNSS